MRIDHDCEDSSPQRGIRKVCVYNLCKLLIKISLDIYITFTFTDIYNAPFPYLLKGAERKDVNAGT